MYVHTLLLCIRPLNIDTGFRAGSLRGRQRYRRPIGGTVPWKNERGRLGALMGIFTRWSSWRAACDSLQLNLIRRSLGLHDHRRLTGAEDRNTPRRRRRDVATTVSSLNASYTNSLWLVKRPARVVGAREINHVTSWTGCYTPVRICTDALACDLYLRQFLFTLLGYFFPCQALFC